MAARPRNRVPLRTLVNGFEGARDRFEAAVGGADRDVIFVTLFEVVAWTGAIADWFRKRSRAKTVPPELQGLWYVRNRMLHYGAEALFQTEILFPQPLGFRGVPGRRRFAGQPSSFRSRCGGRVIACPEAREPSASRSTTRSWPENRSAGL